MYMSTTSLHTQYTVYTCVHVCVHRNELEGIHYTNVDGVKLNEPISEPVYDEAKTDGTDGKGGNGTSKTHNPPAEKTEVQWQPF